MKKIPLTRGLFALVDDEDYILLSKHEWYASRSCTIFYARRNITTTTGKRRTIRLHQEILGTVKGFEIDHINGNGLDNRRINLRFVTHRENMQNRHIKKTSKYPGVSWERDTRKWVVHIRIDGVQRHVGRFEKEDDAANAYIEVCNNPKILPPMRAKTSKYPGVYWNKQNEKWLSRIYLNGKTKSLGYYDDEDVAGTVHAVATNFMKQES